MLTELSIDIETLSTKPNALVLSIGMCWFSKDYPATVSRDVEKDSLIDLPIIHPDLNQPGSHIDADTVQWWMRQSSEAKQVFSERIDREPLSYAVISIMEAVNNATHIWAKDPDFDCVILSHFLQSYSHDGFDWPFWKNRSVRTKLDDVPSAKNLPFEGVQHNALADAVHQARQIQACYASIRNK